MKQKGYIKLSRKSFAHKFWTKARVLSEFEAWIDLIQSARFDEAVKIEYIDGREIKYGRGQYPASIRFLAKKWGWGEQKVRTFLTGLIKDGSVTTDHSQGMNIITLCKYDLYNSAENGGNTAVSTSGNTDIEFLIREVQGLKTQIATQHATHPQHSGNTNTKKEEEYNKETLSNERVKTDSSESSPAREKTDFEKFNNWIKENAPYCSNPKNFSKQITEDEFRKLKEKYTGTQIADIILQIENRKDLRKKYNHLCQTVLNWAKKEYGIK